MLKAKLNRIMKQELEFLELQLGPYCIQQLEQAIGNGIRRMEINNSSSHPGYVLQAEQNLKSLIRYYSGYAENIGTFPLLSELDFDAAQRSAPGLWPYSTSG